MHADAPLSGDDRLDRIIAIKWCQQEGHYKIFNAGIEMDIKCLLDALAESEKRVRKLVEMVRGTAIGNDDERGVGRCRHCYAEWDYPDGQEYHEAGCGYMALAQVGDQADRISNIQSWFCTPHRDEYSESENTQPECLVCRLSRAERSALAPAPAAEKEEVQP